MFRRKILLPFSGSENNKGRNQRESKWRRYVPPKLGLTFNGLHAVISQNLYFLLFFVKYIQYRIMYGIKVCNLKASVCTISSFEDRTMPKQPQIGQPVEKDFSPVVRIPSNSNQLICSHWKHFNNILSRVRVTLDGVFDWRLDLLTTYTHTTRDCTLQAIVRHRLVSSVYYSLC
jgi:hypothetical protein